MKTKVEVNGYEIVIEEKDGMISVSAMKDDEIVEEFELETEEGQGDDEDFGDEDVQGFDEFGQDEEDDFDSEEDEDFGQGQDEDEDFGQGQDEDEDEDEDEDFGQEDEDDEESKLESFQSFINKKRK